MGFLDDVVAGLSSRPRRIPAKYFYDERGAELYEAICRLPEYYPARTELTILEKGVGVLAEAGGPRAYVFELGAGSGRKTEILLAALPDPRIYVAIDVCASALAGLKQRLEQRFPGLEVVTVTGDFDAPWPLPERPGAGRRIAFFPGSTIGNLGAAQRVSLLRRVRRALGGNGCFVVGIDLVKDPDRLVRAYDDPRGVTAAFDLHLLERIRDELGAGVEIEAFAHKALWNAEEERIEMHLVATRPTTIELRGRRFSFAAGETIVTEHCHKFRIDRFRREVEAVGFTVEHVLTDPDRDFAVLILAVTGGERRGSAQR